MSSGEKLSLFDLFKINLCEKYGNHLYKITLNRNTAVVHLQLKNQNQKSKSKLLK